MKKKIIIGLLMVSALSFGAANNNSGNMNNNTSNNGQRGTYRTQMMSNLTEDQQTELTKVMQDRREDNYKKSLDMRSKQLELEKLLAQDKVNWKSVERVNKQISDMKAEQRLDGMKFRSNMEDKYGISMGHKGMASMGGKHTNGNKMNGGHMGNRTNNSNHMNGGNGNRNN